MTDNNGHKATVFISCGMANKEEKDFAKRLKDFLNDLSKEYKVFISSEQHTLEGVNEHLIKKLKESDYYVFVDLKREKLSDGNDHRGSLYTHQELAWAYVLGLKDVLFLRQKDDAFKTEGLLKYWLCNPIDFNNLDLDQTLKTKITKKIESLGWDPKRSRHMQVELLRDSNPIKYKDHTEYKDCRAQEQHVVKAKIENRRSDIPARNCVATLWEIENISGNGKIGEDKSNLKWADRAAYTGFIRSSKDVNAPESADICLFAINAHNKTEVYLQSERDHNPREPIISGEGTYKLKYRIYADDFPMKEFTVQLELITGQWEPDKQVKIIPLDDVKPKPSDKKCLVQGCGGTTCVGKIPYAVEENGKIYVIKNVPIRKCNTCGHWKIDEDIANRLKELLKSRPLSDMAVFDFESFEDK